MQGYHHSDGRLWVTVPGKLAILPWFDHWVQPKLLWTFQGLVPSFAFEEMVKSQEERENGWLDSWEVLVIEFQNFFEKTSLSFARGDLMKSMTSWLIPLITSSLRESAMNSRLMNLRTRGMMKLTPMRWTDSTRSWTRWGTSNEKNNWLTTWLKNVTIEMPTRKTSCDVEWPWWKDMVELEKLEKVPDPFVLSDGKKKKKSQGWGLIGGDEKQIQSQRRPLRHWGAANGLTGLPHLRHGSPLNARLRDDSDDPYTTAEEMFKSLTLAYQNSHREMEPENGLLNLQMKIGDKFSKFLARFLYFPAKQESSVSSTR